MPSVILKGQEELTLIYSEPFRLFFPTGILYLVIGALLWLPQIWSAENYPVLLHRYFVLNGFAASFIGGFLMTAVPRFSKTMHARKGEVLVFFFITIAGILAATFDLEHWVHVVSTLQALFLVFFIFTRIRQRKENPPYSFIFIFAGLLLWIVASVAGYLGFYESFKDLHYEGAIAAIILGVGSRLIPGILGHVEIVRMQRESYERPVPLLQTVPWYFFLIMIAFVGSYFAPESYGVVMRAAIVVIVGLFYWQLLRLPIERTALTWCLWIAGWLILASFFIRAFWNDLLIHGAHAFFVNGIVLLSILIATRVIQSHGPKEKSLEDWKGLYVVTFLLAFASATRVSAYLIPEHYLTHLGYSSIVLVLGVLIWSWKYLRFVKTMR